ncbi:alpha/beta fold hydrolase [Phenylobacterium sp.]|uniref:alpha/beta fold hydrolase n=1 Tax=Phenylobacterium sp. TaxID=1871053 RepID=UPI0035B2CCD0
MPASSRFTLPGLKPKARANVSFVIETMYAIAANPDRWEEVIDALGEAPGEAVEPAAMEAMAAGVVRAAAQPMEAAAGPQVGVVMISPSGGVTSCNAAGEAVFQQRLGLLEAKGLRFFDPSNHEALAQARRRLREARTGQVIVKFTQADDEGPHFAYVVPAAALPASLAASLPDARAPDSGVAIIFPAVEATDRLWASIRESFGLTAAETRLAARLKEGLTLKEAAAALGVSVNTVRNQLRAVFDKMGLNRQSELVRALTQLGALAGVFQPDEAHAGGFGPAILATERGAAESAPPVRLMRLADGRRIAYRDYGAPRGRPALLVHQGLGSSLLPRGSDVLARDLGLRLICPERPGVGRSDPRHDYSFQGVGRDLAAICDGLGLEEVRVAGFMSGSAFALSAAEALGERASRVLLVSARPPGLAPETERDARHRLVQFRRRLFRSAWLADAVFAVMRVQMTRNRIGRIVRTGASAPSDAAYLASHPAVVEFIADYIRESLAVSARGIADEVRAAAREEGFQAPPLAAPVALWHGADDPLATPGEATAWLGRAAGETRVFADIGHFLPHKHWPEVLAWLAA